MFYASRRFFIILFCLILSFQTTFSSTTDLATDASFSDGTSAVEPSSTSFSTDSSTAIEPTSTIDPSAPPLGHQTGQSTDGPSDPPLGLQTGQSTDGPSSALHADHTAVTFADPSGTPPQNHLDSSPGSPDNTATAGPPNGATSPPGQVGTGLTTIFQIQQTDGSSVDAFGTNTKPTDNGIANTATDSRVSSSTRDPTATHIVNPVVTTGNPTVAPITVGTVPQASEGPTTTTTTTTTTTPAGGFISVAYILIASSNQNIAVGVTNDARVLAQMQRVIETLFDLSVVWPRVIRVFIIQRARAVNTNYSVEVDIDFYPRTGSCDRNCVEAAKIPGKPAEILLPSAINGELVTATTDGALVQKETPPIRIGESSPGLAARLGMGLGISFLGVLLIGEIAFFIWRSRSAKPARALSYANGS